jgi:hypothetical protein
MSIPPLIGGPVLQLRQAIKDLLYRNRQERIAGELDLAREQLAILREHGLLPGPEQTRELIIELAPRTPLARALRTGRLPRANTHAGAASVERHVLPLSPACRLESPPPPSETESGQDVAQLAHGTPGNMTA